MKRLKIYPSWQDGIKVLSQAKNTRDHLAMHLALYQALREGEMFGSQDSKGRHGNLNPLTIGQLQSDKILIYGKGGTIEYVFLDPLAQDLIKKHLGIRRKKLKSSDQLFYLTTRQFQRIVKQAAMDARVEDAKRFSPHVLRAISITRMASIKGLSRAKYHARHSSIRTTAIYDRPSTQERQADFKDVFIS